MRGDVLLLTVADDGKGFNPADLGRSEFPRFGLVTMRERAESVGAKLEVSASPSGGTLVKLELPLPRPAAAAAAAV